MIRLSNYGNKVEEYEYHFDTKKNELKEISYTLFGKHDGEETAVVGVYNDNGVYKRCVVLWPSSDPNNHDDIHQEENIDEMRLYLDTADRNFDFKDVSVYRYETSDDKRESEFFVNTIPNSGPLAFKFAVRRNHVAVYNSKLKMIKVFKVREQDGSIDYSEKIEKIRITDFGAVTETADMVHVMRVGSLDAYKYSLFPSPIECLEMQCKEVSLQDGKVYNVTYNEFGMVEKVSSSVHNIAELLFSRSEGEDLLSINTASGGSTIIGYNYDSIYPSMLHLNHLNYQYPFLQLWTHDRMRITREHKIQSFSRVVYYIEDMDELLMTLRDDLNKLKINY